MNLEDKLRGVPKIYYLNLDERVDRKEYMETQFNYWGVKYKRISGSNYLFSKFNEWSDILSNQRNCKFGPRESSNFVSHILMIKDWLENTNEDTMIMMEDDYDLSLIKYWNFDWEYLMDNIPHDWDCIQLGFESFSSIKFFLHEKQYDTNFGACMINRPFAEKLLKLYYKNNKVIVDYKTCDYNRTDNYNAANIDYAVCNNGKTYCIPLIPQNPHFTSWENFDPREGEFKEHFYKTHEIYHFWWKNEHHKFRVENFFMYNKPEEIERKMTKQIKFSKSFEYR